MEKIKKIFTNNKKTFFVGFIIIFILSLPLMQHSLVIGDDYDYHLSRIQSITDSLRNSIFPVKIHPQLANSYGYASGLFYPNLFLYIPALIHLAGISLTLSYKIFIFIMLCFMFIITYISMNDITENKTFSLVGTIIIMLSMNVILNLYYRFALGEFLGSMFILPVISGMHNYVHKNFKKPYLLLIGFLGLINTHLITTLICLVFCIFYFLFYVISSLIHIFKSHENNKNYIFSGIKKFFKLLLVAIIVLLLSCSFWMPMLEQLSTQTFKLSVPWTHIENDEFRLIDLFGTTKYSIGYLITLFMLLIIYGLLDKKISNITKKYCLWIIFIVILITNFKFWQLTNEYSNIIQFKWRLIGILTVICSIAISLLLKEYTEKFNFNSNKILISILVLAIYFSVQYLSSSSMIDNLISEEDLQNNMYLNATSIGGGAEYLPVEVDYYTLTSPTSATSSSGDIIEIQKTNLRAEFKIESNTSTWYDVPYIYYYGYVANITTSSGEIINLEIQKSDSGLVRIIIPENISGNITVWYNGTKIQKISYIISIFTLILIFITIIIKKFIFFKSYNKKQSN